MITVKTRGCSSSGLKSITVGLRIGILAAGMSVNSKVRGQILTVIGPVLTSRFWSANGLDKGESMTLQRMQGILVLSGINTFRVDYGF